MKQLFEAASRLPRSQQQEDHRPARTLPRAPCWTLRRIIPLGFEFTKKRGGSFFETLLMPDGAQPE
jgi:hypothetical protein